MKILACLAVCFLFVACGSGNQQAETENQPSAMKTAEETAKEVAGEGAVVELATRNVTCGCALADVGKCGNYIEIDSKYLEIANGDALGLGMMEWCGRSGVKANSAGVIQDGKFVAATLEEE